MYKPAPLIGPILEYPFAEQIPQLGGGVLANREQDDLPPGVTLHYRATHQAETLARLLAQFFDIEGGGVALDYPNFDLSILASYLLPLYVHDLVGELARFIPGYSSDDLSLWLLHDVFGHEGGPLAAPSPYRAPRDYTDEMIDDLEGTPKYVSCADISASLTILYILDRLHELYEVTYPETIARDLLQTWDSSCGLFLEQEEPGSSLRKLDEVKAGSTTLQVLVSLAILDHCFGAHEFRHLDGDRLKTTLSHLLDKCLRQLLIGNLQPHYDRLWHKSVCDILAAARILEDRLGIQLRTRHRADKALMRLIGLERVWELFVQDTQEKVSDFHAGVEFFRSLHREEPQRLRRLLEEARSSEGRVARSGYTTLFRSIASLSHGGWEAAAAIACLAFTEPTQSEFSLGGYDYHKELIVMYLLRHDPLLSLTNSLTFWYGDHADNFEVLLTNRSAVDLLNVKVVEDLSTNSVILQDEDRAIRIESSIERISTSEIPASGTASFIVRARAELTGIPYLHLRYPELTVISCEYRGHSWELRLRSCDVFHLPPRQEIATMISDESSKAHHDRHVAIRSLKRRLFSNYGIRMREVSAGALYDSFLQPGYDAWIRQVEPEDWVLLERLYRHLRVYSLGEMRGLLSNALNNKIPKDDLKGAVFIGIGRHMGKSGPHLLYYLKHIWRNIFPGATSEDVKRAFAHPSDLLKSAEMVAQTSTVILVDDFVGTGSQASKDRDRLKENLGSLWRLPKYLLVISGFEDGLGEIQKAIPDLTGTIIVADRILDSEERAFISERVFPNTKQRKKAERLCKEIGHELLKRRFPKKSEREKHLLGWYGSQALVVFPHNTPNNTLPIFWEQGTYREKPWRPLFPRWD